MEPIQPKYAWGQRVCAVDDLFNDGSFPDQLIDALLVQVGDAGEIVQVGTHTELQAPIYLVEFAPSRVVGVLEDEIKLIEATETNFPVAGAATLSGSQE